MDSDFNSNRGCIKKVYKFFIRSDIDQLSSKTNSKNR